MGAELDRLAAEKYILLTTFRKDGRAVPTPVWVARDSEQLLVWTVLKSGKVKRIRRDGAVELAPSDQRGKPTGEPVPGRARLLDQTEVPRVTGLVGRKYGLLGRVLIFFSWLRYRTSGMADIGITVGEATA
jgi:PPOX class probable F420-dependent enzyme